MEILTNKAYKDFNYISRYSPSPYYYHILDDKYVVGTAKQLSDKTIYFEYTVQRNDTYDKIALRYYNNPTLYWIICSFNHIDDPFENPEVGSTLKIPSISDIEFI